MDHSMDSDGNDGTDWYGDDCNEWGSDGWRRHITILHGHDDNGIEGNGDDDNDDDGDNDDGDDDDDYDDGDGDQLRNNQMLNYM